MHGGAAGVIFGMCLARRVILAPVRVTSDLTLESDRHVHDYGIVPDLETGVLGVSRFIFLQQWSGLARCALLSMEPKLRARLHFPRYDY